MNAHLTILAAMLMLSPTELVLHYATNFPTIQVPVQAEQAPMIIQLPVPIQKVVATSILIGLPRQKVAPVPRVILPPDNNLYLSWAEPDTNAIGFELHDSIDLLSWKLLATTGNTRIAVPKTNFWGQWKWVDVITTNADESLVTNSVQMLFTNLSDNFLVRATNAFGECSDWWTK